MTQEGPEHPHPAPHRGRVSIWWLLAGLAIPPGGWIAEMLIGVAITDDTCPLTGGSARAHGFTGEGGLLVAIMLVCLAAVIASGAMSWRHWSAVRREGKDSAHAHLTVGEGRTRFLALAGMLSAATFAIAILFNLLEPFLIPLCWSAR